MWLVPCLGSIPSISSSQNGRNITHLPSDYHHVCVHACKLKNLPELLFKVLNFVAKFFTISAHKKTRVVAHSQLGYFHIHLLLILSCVVLASPFAPIVVWMQQLNRTKSIQRTGATISISFIFCRVKSLGTGKFVVLCSGTAYFIFHQL